jgi:uncharacterized protein (TIGR03437 family)
VAESSELGKGPAVPDGGESMTNLRTLSILTLVYAPVLAAQTAPNWTQQSPDTSPIRRFAHNMVYDSAQGQVVLFGGTGYSGGFINFNDTWVWDGSNWTQESPQNSPPIRNGPGMAYDSAHDQVVLYGGEYGRVPYTDTWLWDGTNWTQVFPTTSPSVRTNPAMAYDPVHGQMILFGGVVGNNFSFLNDTWVWDGTNWTEVFPQTSPPARFGHQMAYDSAHGKIVMFGGATSSLIYGDTWLWDGSNWTQAPGVIGPPARYNYAMAYDISEGQAVIFGGFGASGDLSDTWLWNGSYWTQQQPQSSPAARSGPAMAYDAGHDQVVLFGGIDDLTTQYFSDTWTWSAPIVVPPPTPGPSISGVVSASDFGGFSAVAPGSWVEIYGTNLAPSTQSWTGADFTGNDAPTMLNGVSVSIGGQAAFVDYIAPTQVNAQLPSNIATGGTLQLTVINANGTSTAVNITVNPTEPGLLAPTSFQINGKQYVVAQHSNGTYVLPVGAISGVASSPAKPGETIVIYGVGFGSVNPNIPAGEIATVTNQLSASLEILFGKTPATLPYFGLAPNFVGLYQFNVTVPAVPDNDLVPLSFNLGGVAGSQTLFSAVQQ